MSGLRLTMMAGIAALAAACAGCGASSYAADASAQSRISALEQHIATLERETQRLEDVRAIKRLQRAFGYYFDAGDWDQMADLFAADGSIEMGLDGVYVGQARVRQYLHALGRGHQGLAPGELHEHLQLQPVIDLAADGRTAKGRWRDLILQGQYHERAEWGEGPYENEYVKDHGVWKVQRLHWYQTFVVPYDGGWARNKDVNGGRYVSGQLPPDRPPSERYETWPGVYIPPFHYPNPVTGK
jgi:hypothetical protein